MTLQQPVTRSAGSRLFWIGIYSGIPGILFTALGGAITLTSPSYHEFLRGAILGGTAGSILGNLWILADPKRLSFLSERKEKYLRLSYAIGSVLAAIAVVVQSWIIVRELRSVEPLRTLSAGVIQRIEIHTEDSAPDRQIDDQQAVTDLAACLRLAEFRSSASASRSRDRTITIRLQGEQAVSLTCGKDRSEEDLALGRLTGGAGTICCTVPGLGNWIARYAAVNPERKVL
ncbi:MAG: hypothetical protein HZB26_24645 [Candidatus Hydrogenedentes bacterium]|nr:hypothetical protein [Candidatus Hydrogenedentota bacterium]